MGHFLSYTDVAAPLTSGVGAPALRWASAVREGKIHGLMGYREGAPPSWEQDPSYWVTDKGIAEGFVQNLATKTVKEAWLQANGAPGRQYVYKKPDAIPSPKYYSPLFAVAIFNDENVDDMLKDNTKITADPQGNNVIYYYFDFVYDEDSTGNVRDVVERSAALP